MNRPALLVSILVLAALAAAYTVYDTPCWKQEGDAYSFPVHIQSCGSYTEYGSCINPSRIIGSITARGNFTGARSCEFEPGEYFAPLETQDVSVSGARGVVLLESTLAAMAPDDAGDISACELRSLVLNISLGYGHPASTIYRFPASIDLDAIRAARRSALEADLASGAIEQHAASSYISHPVFGQVTGELVCHSNSMGELSQGHFGVEELTYPIAYVDIGTYSEDCSNGVDDNFDGDADCADYNCRDLPECECETLQCGSGEHFDSQTCACIKEPGLCQNACPGAQKDYPDCSCVADALESVSGRIYYVDLLGRGVGFRGVEEERGLGALHYRFKYAGKSFEGYTDSNGRYSIEFEPALQIDETDMAELTVIMEDEGGTFFVGTASRSLPAPLQDFYGGSAGEFPAYLEVEDSDETFDFEMSSQGEAQAAKIYYNMKAAVDYAEGQLGEPVDKSTPVPVLITPEGDTAYHAGGVGIAIGDDCAVLSYPDAPSNREWHEFGHYIQYDGFARFPRWNGDTNHGSFANPSSTDSLVEGWAEIFSALVKKEAGGKWNLYPVGYSYYNLEANYRIVGRGSGAPDEEIVAAAILFDLLDGKSAADSDSVEIPAKEFWAFFKNGSYSFSDGTNGSIYNLADLYDALSASGRWGLDKDDDSDGLNNLDEIFVAHGLFQDDDGNLAYDSGESIGTTLKPSGGARRKIQPRAGSYVALDIVTEDGKRPNSIIEVSVDFPAPYDIYDYGYEVFLPSGQRTVNLEMPDEYFNATATISASVDGASPLSANYTVTSGEYWANAASPSPGQLGSHRFVFREAASEDTSGVAPDYEEYCDGEDCDDVCYGAAILLLSVCLTGAFIQARAAA